MNLLGTIFLFAQQTGEGGSQSGGWSMIVFLVLMVAIFYFFMIRPQKKKEKEAQAFRSNLQRGDKVVTIGGIHGKITEVQESTFTIETEDGSKMKIEKAAVSHTVKE